MLCLVLVILSIVHSVLADPNNDICRPTQLEPKWNRSRNILYGKDDTFGVEILAQVIEKKDPRDDIEKANVSYVPLNFTHVEYEGVLEDHRYAYLKLLGDCANITMTMSLSTTANGYRGKVVKVGVSYGGQVYSPQTELLSFNKYAEHQYGCAWTWIKLDDPWAPRKIVKIENISFILHSKDVKERRKAGKRKNGAIQACWDHSVSCYGEY